MRQTDARRLDCQTPCSFSLPPLFPLGSPITKNANKTQPQAASKSALSAYALMSSSPEFQSPLSWSAPEFSLESYNLVFLPGGHEKGVRQLIDSEIIHAQLAIYFPQTKKPSSKTVAAVCHGVMVLSETEGDGGKSVIHECTTTALPGFFEKFAFWYSRAWLGDYYKTYGVGSDDVEASVSLLTRLGRCERGNMLMNRE
jgi:hypothetical protein